MPFKHFLTSSLNFERTHQLILQCLFNDPLFLKTATGVSAEGYRVILEPVKGLFDIGILDAEDELICLMELKMWSSLSGPQLDRQWKYLEQYNCPGVHILLGTSDLQFHRDETYDDIAERTYGRSCKVGYNEMIRILEKFGKVSTEGAPITVIANDYKNALQGQADQLEKAWLNNSANLHHRSYSAYHKIRKYLLDDDFYIYTVNNPGGTAHILNDDRSWTEFTYKGEAFTIYQEMLDLEMMIRIESEGVPYETKTALKQDVVRLLKEKDPYTLPWSFSSRTSRYHKIAIYRPTLETEDDCRKVANMLKTYNPIIKAIVSELKDRETEEFLLN